MILSMSSESLRYKYLSKTIIDRISSIGKEIPIDEYDSLKHKRKYKKNIRS